MPNVQGAKNRRRVGAGKATRCSQCCEGRILQRERRRAAAAAAANFPTMPPMAENVLDVSGVYHSTSVPSSESSCLAARSEPTAVLRDVSARVYGGEVLAVLGSKGSGKRALLDVIGEYINSISNYCLLS